MHRRAPLWLMGLTNATFGMYGGIVVVSTPQLLAAKHVPEATIAAITAASKALLSSRSVSAFICPA